MRMKSGGLVRGRWVMGGVGFQGCFGACGWVGFL